MASQSRKNSNPLETTSTTSSTAIQNVEAPDMVKEEEPGKTKKPQNVRPNYHKIHSRKMPLAVYPLPTFIPHNPISYLQVAFNLLQDFHSPRQSHPETPYQGYFSAATRSVHVTDPATVRALWEMGFFGKGLLSRSEPDWLKMEKRRLGLDGSVTAAEVTGRRRQEREQFKRERARLEREALEEQKRKEARLANRLETKSEQNEQQMVASIDDPPSENASSTKIDEDPDSVLAPTDGKLKANGCPTSLNHQRSNHKSFMSKSLLQIIDEYWQAWTLPESINTPRKEDIPDTDESDGPVNQEHLQLSSEEAFYLSYALGVLDVIDPRSSKVISDQNHLLELFRCHSFFPPVPSNKLRPDDHFLMSYVVYHHFRSLGWTVRDGIKFAVDYLLYERGPAFNHAAFAIIIIPSYTHSYWFESPERVLEVEKKKTKKDWHRLHCINRVQGQVVKTLVLVYVDVPPPIDVDNDAPVEDVGFLLRSYKIREFCVQRWSVNRNRE
jgi:tRNA-splicing endonuclease subunit Sen2